MARGKRHSDETRAAVMAALMAGQGVGEVAKEFGIPIPTVSTWASSVSFEQVRTKREADFGELVADYARATLETLRKQQEFFGDIEWLRKQPASELAVLHGVSADKALRILEAAERAAQAQPEPVSD